MNRYELLANTLERAIRAGKLRPGDRLTSVRELSESEGVSPSTVVQAYELLQARGWVEARPRSGFFVSERPAASDPPRTGSGAKLLTEPSSLEPEELILALRQALDDPKILPLGGAIAAPEFLPYKAVSRAQSRVLREEPALSSEYLFPPGSRALRDQIAKRHRRLGVTCDADAIVTTAGAVDALCLALRAVMRPGAIVLVESPTYFGILQAVRALGHPILEVPVHPERGLEPSSFAAALREHGPRLGAAVLVPNHSNPLGALMPDEAKAEIVRLAAAAGVTLLEDDVYGDLAFGARRPKPLKAFDTSDDVILCSSFVKTIAPSLRTGFVISAKHAKAITILRSSLASGTNVISEETLAAYLSGGGYDRHLRWVTREYRTLLAKFTAAVLRHFPEGTRVSAPRGGYVLWVQLPNRIDTRVVQKKALAAGINIASGPLFSARGAYRDCLRLNCAVPWTPQLERGIARLGALISG